MEANEDHRLKTLKYNLGMISMLEQENARMQYEKQQNEYNSKARPAKRPLWNISGLRKVFHNQ